MAADRRPDGSAVSPATMVGTAYRRRDRSKRSTAKRVWIAAPIMWRRMKTILSPRPRRVVKLQEVAKQAKPWGLRSCRRKQWPLLPSEIVATILSWLPVKSLMRFRCVCKEWRSLTYNPNFIKKHHTCARALGRIALISRGYSSPKIVHYDFGDNGEVRNQVLNMRFGDVNRHRVSNPVNGLIFIEYLYMWGERSHYLLNPATQELAKLSTCGKSTWGQFTNFGLGFDSSTGGYKLVKLFSTKGSWDSCACTVLELGTQEWRGVGRAPCTVPDIEPVLLNGALNWLSRRGLTEIIITFNLKDENFRSIPVPLEYGFGGGHMYLAEWEGVLCIVKILRMEVPESVSPSGTGRRSSVRIWRLEDYETGRWVEAHCSELRNHACGGDWLYPVGIRGHEMLMVTNWKGGLGSICRYDLHTRSLRELYTDPQSDLQFPVFPSGLQFLTESLVSPRYLAGNPSLH